MMMLIRINITHQDFPRETSLHSQDGRLNKFLFATKMKTCVLITPPIALQVDIVFGGNSCVAITEGARTRYQQSIKRLRKSLRRPVRSTGPGSACCSVHLVVVCRTEQKQVVVAFCCDHTGNTF